MADNGHNKDTQLANVRAIQPTRVLLSGHDKRFIKLASFLLARRGFQVSSTENSVKLMEIVESEPFDVVIIDGTSSLSAAATTAAALAALHPHIRVLLATEREDAGWRGGHRVISKWRGIEDLPEEVHRAHLGTGTPISNLEAS